MAFVTSRNIFGGVDGERRFISQFPLSSSTQCGLGTQRASLMICKTASDCRIIKELITGMRQLISHEFMTELVAIKKKKSFVCSHPMSCDSENDDIGLCGLMLG